MIACPARNAFMGEPPLQRERKSKTDAAYLVGHEWIPVIKTVLQNPQFFSKGRFGPLSDPFRAFSRGSRGVVSRRVEELFSLADARANDLGKPDLASLPAVSRMAKTTGAQRVQVVRAPTGHGIRAVKNRRIPAIQ